ncbi:hypothetical protein ABEF95_007417 [Exophiala dermatitidis]
MAIPKPSLDQLMQSIKANIKRYRIEQASVPRPAALSRAEMMEEDTEVEFTTRTTDQEVCAVEISPLHPEYMIIGTYSLVKKDDRRDYEAQTRKGSLQIMTVSETFKPRYAGMLPPQLHRVDFASAVLDLHFHPADGSLLGVATSNAQMQFFRFVKHGDVLGRRVMTKLILLGTATVADPDEHGLVPLVTQFLWFPEMRVHGVSAISDVQQVSFAVTTSLGETRVVKVALPAIKDMFDERLSRPGTGLEQQQSLHVEATTVHQHDLEAWTVASIDLPAGASEQQQQEISQRLILSGGDDSALIASAWNIDTWESICSPLWKDRRTHTAGVVSILPLAPVNTFTPLITGSYDEFIRIYELNPSQFPFRATFKTELRLNGGVWRLKVLDQYSSNNNNHQHQHHTLILASLMHGGASILRLTHTYDSGSSQSDTSGTGIWTITPLTLFRSGHESMVYCCDAIREHPDASAPMPGADAGPAPTKSGPNHAAEHKHVTIDKEDPTTAPPTYTVVSTSFYDKKICTWTFVDRFKAEIL